MTEHAMLRERAERPTTRALVELLGEARERTLALIAPLGDDDVRRQHDPLMSPIVWDLGHIAHFEELWLGRNLDGPIEFSEMPGLYDPFQHPRSVRGALPLPDLPGAIALMRESRAPVSERVGALDLASHDPLVGDGYVVRMVAQHEYQHDETILQTLQLKQGAPYAAPRAEVPPSVTGARLALEAGAMVRFPGGRVGIGTDDRSAAYDNERPRHVVDVRPFWIDVTPVTNGAYAAFIDDGGYDRRALWSEAGWEWREREGLIAPKYWSRDAHGWTERMFDHIRAIDVSRPVCHVCYHEAEAFARWAGKRLPSEIEWEAAATWDPGAERKRELPWGDDAPAPGATHLESFLAAQRFANLDQLRFDTTPVGTYARNVSPIGCYGMIGDVWEWTSSDFAGYPGFESFPYREYSEAFFGSEYKVLRGGSFATRPGAMRGTFRNWDYPIRRQIFSGFRCARDG